jgi:hypothetical protein
MHVGDMGLFLAQSELESIKETVPDLPLDVLCQAFRPTYSNNPVIGISQIFDPEKIRIVFSYRGPLLGDPQVALALWYVRRCPLRRFPFLTGWGQRKLRQDTRIVLAASATGFGIGWACKMVSFSHDSGSSNEPSPYTS